MDEQVNIPALSSSKPTMTHLEFLSDLWYGRRWALSLTKDEASVDSI